MKIYPPHALATLGSLLVVTGIALTINNHGFVGALCLLMGVPIALAGFLTLD